MAEIVGVVSSVIAFTEDHRAIGDFRSATKERDDILRRLSNVEVNLKKLEAVLSKFDSNDPDLETIRQPLEDFKSTIQNLTDRLKPSENASGLSIRERLSWVVKGKGQAKEDSTKIEEFEQLLAKWLSLDTWDKVRKHAYGASKILDWLSPINFFARQNEIFSTRQPDTGTWLLESSEFQKWKAGEEETLWCVGMPGAGKTVMA
ncbi:hypothetical protein FS842_005694 [Serendipita sp. 407]|nr:hypothetical protein FS842_005694 [Serendipita sp. 407]